MNDAQSNRSNDSLKHGAYICPYDPNEARPEGYTNSYNSSGNNNYLPLAKPIAEPDPEAGIIPAILLNLAVLLVIALSVAFPPLGMVIALAALSVIVHSLALGAIEASSKSFQNSKNNPNEGSITPTVVESGAGLGRTAVEQNQTNVPRQAISIVKLLLCLLQ